MVAAIVSRRSRRKPQKPDAFVPGDTSSSAKGQLSPRNKITKGPKGRARPQPPKGATRFTTQAGESDIGLSVACYWEKEKRWFKGKFKKARERTKSEPRNMLVKYDDGEEEWVSVPDDTILKLPGRGQGRSSKAPVRKIKTVNTAKSGGPTKHAKPNKKASKASKAPAPKGAKHFDSAGGPHSVGLRVAVYWPRENAWFQGTIESFKEEDGQDNKAQGSGQNLFLRYDDGEEEWIGIPDDTIVMLPKEGREPSAGGGGESAGNEIIPTPTFTPVQPVAALVAAVAE